MDKSKSKVSNNPKNLPPDERNLLIAACKQPIAFGIASVIDKLRARGFIRFYVGDQGGWAITAQGREYAEAHNLIDKPAPAIPEPLTELETLRARVKELEAAIEEIQFTADDAQGEWVSVMPEYIPDHDVKYREIAQMCERALEVAQS